jgi:hypothetical protein
VLYCLSHSAAWLFTLAGIGNLILAGYLFRYGNRSSTISWFQLFVGCSGFFYIAESAMVCAATPVAFRIWHDIFAAAISLLIVLPFIFAVYFTNRPRLLDRLEIRVILLVVPLVMLWLMWQTGLVHSRNFFEREYLFGYAYPGYGSLTGLFGVVILISYLIPITMVARYYYGLEDRLKRQEVRLILIALVLGIAIPMTVEGLLPAFLHVPTLPIGPTLSLIMNGLIVYAITRYGLRVFSLDHISPTFCKFYPAA